ncbi:MAG: class I SAM-dependent methyltransferase [Solirubrobacterales bacterium]
MPSPSTGDVGLGRKAREWTGFFEGHRRRRGDRRERGYVADVDEYAGLAREHRGRGLEGSEVLEIGFGPRAPRLAVLSAAGARPTGVDMEAPLLELTPAALWRIQRRNGFERLAKSLARHLLFDPAARRNLRAAIARRYGTGELDYGRLEVGDAADLRLAEGSLDLVVSEDVFEHVATASLHRTLEGMRRWLKPDGLALIRPNVYTGISGGHLAEWSVESVLDDPAAPRRSEPWEHLRGDRFPANTCLNRLSLADYRRAFAAHGFEILEQRCRHPRLGEPLLTPALREELSAWPDEELFSNQVLFVLRAL